MPAYNSNPPQFRNQQNNQESQLDVFEQAKQRALQSQANTGNRGLALDIPSQFPASKPEGVKQSFAEKLLSFTGGNILARATGLGIAQTGTKETMDEAQANEGEMQQRLIQAIRKNKLQGKDTTRLENALEGLTGGIKETGDQANDLYTEGITTKQVIGDAVQLASTASLGSSLGNVAGNTFKSGLKLGAAQGLGFGAVEGVSSGLKDNKDTMGVIQSGLIGAGIGTLGGGVLGAGLGAISGKLSGKAGTELTDSLLDITLRSKYKTGKFDTGALGTAYNGVKNAITGVNKAGAELSDKAINQFIRREVSSSPVAEGATKLGFSERDAALLSTLNDADKPVIEKMFNTSVSAQTNPRQIERAADVVGDSIATRFTAVQDEVNKAGAELGETARNLQGQTVTPESLDTLKQNIYKDLESIQVRVGADGKLDFSQSAFRDIPQVQKRIQSAVNHIPTNGEAQSLHTLKQEVREFADFGTMGEGIKGKASNILKGIGHHVDEALDTSFPQYKALNERYRYAITLRNRGVELIGKKRFAGMEIDSPQASQLFGQKIRSIFSNNATRGDVLRFVAELQDFAEQLGLKGADQNIIDQALVYDIIEKLFGSEATMSLSGEVTKAIDAAQMGGKVINAIRNPASGALNLAADVAEKLTKRTPEQRQKFLQELLKSSK